MRYVVLFEDDPAKADIRPKLMPDHQAFLKRNAGAILEAGPLVEAGAPRPAGFEMSKPAASKP